VVAAVVIAGCASEPSSLMVPESLLFSEGFRRFEGSVSVNVAVDALSLRPARPRAP